MGFLQFILAAEPNYRQPKSGRKAGFKINSAAMPCEISDEKFAATNPRNDFVINFIVVLFSVNSEWFISRIPDSGFDGRPSAGSTDLSNHIAMKPTWLSEISLSQGFHIDHPFGLIRYQTIHSPNPSLLSRYLCRNKKP